MAERLNILGVGIDCIDSEEALTQIENFIADGNPHQVVTANAEIIYQASRNE